MERRFNIHVCFLLLCFGIGFVRCTEFVPVFIWESYKPSDHVYALHKVSEDCFRENILKFLDTKPFVVVFAERSLSPEDFSQKNPNEGFAFEYLSNLRKSAKLTYKPYVANPLSVIKQLDREVSTLPVSSVLDNIRVLPKDTILIVDLNDAKEDERRNDMLKRHDSYIKSLHDDIKQLYGDNVLALYTAYHTSWITPEDFTEHKSRRNLLAEEAPVAEANEAAGSFFFTNEIFLAIGKNVTVVEKNDMKTVTLDKIKVTTDAPENKETFSALVSDTDGSFNLNMTFSVIVNTGYYEIEKVTLKVGKVDNAEVALPNITVPVTFSYHCGNATFKSTKDPSTYVSLEGFQVYPFIFNNITNVTKHRFPDAYDCVGFTSVPIWSGIFVTFILLFILTFGLTMMLDIKTMDRFDDPKGKTIVINASE